jgi:hypothetical protein
MNITKKGLLFYIRPKVITAFNRLKELFITALILVLFDLKREIVIETYILRFAIAAILS